MKRIKTIARSVTAVLLGYGVLIAGTTWVQESLLGGASYRTSGFGTLLAAAGILTPLAGVVAGAVTGGIARVRPLLHALPIMLAIGVETTALYRTGRVDGPLWFEAPAGCALAGGVLAGAALPLLRRAERN